MRFKRRKREGGGVEASSLSDILFFLMLFFLMVSTLSSQEAIKVYLPKASTGKAIPKHIIYVTIDAEHKYYVNNNQVSSSTLKDNLAKESAAAAQNQNTTIVLRVDKTLPVQEFIDVVEIANKLKLNIVVATDKPN